MTKRDLLQVGELYRRKKAYEDMIERIQASAMRVTANLTGMPRGNQYRDAMAEYIVKLDAAERTLGDILAELTETIARCEECIRRLPPPEAAVIWMRYIEGKEWKRIRREIPYSERMIFYHHSSALKKLAGMKP